MYEKKGALTLYRHFTKHIWVMLKQEHFVIEVLIVLSFSSTDNLVYVTLSPKRSEHCDEISDEYFVTLTKESSFTSTN